MPTYHEIDRVLNKLGKTIIPGIFEDKNEYDKARSILLVKYERNKYPEKDCHYPLSFKYFRDNLIFLCKHYPELVGTVAALGIDEPKHWVPDLKAHQSSELINWENLSIETIANAEHLFRDARQRIRELLSNPGPSDQICNRLIDQIKPLTGAESYQDIRRIYWILYCELRVTLQFHKPGPNWDFYFDIGDFPEHWFKLRGENDVCVLKYLNDHSLDMYLNNPEEFRNGVLETAKGECVSEPESPVIDINISKEIPLQINLFEKIELIPRNNIAKEIFGKEHKNLVKITKSGKLEVCVLPDEQFVYIYLLAVERKIFKDEIWIWRNEELSPKAKDILKNKLGIKRDMKWFTDSGQKATVMSNINKKIPSLIESNEKNYNTYYTLNRYIAADILFI